MKKNLILTPLKFYSYDDEEIFFTLLNKIECISNYEGIGKKLIAYISSEKISFTDYRNLYALFKRYKLKNLNQLEKLFKNEDNKDWFD